MPIYAIDLKKPTNFAKLQSFNSSSKEAREIWKEALQNDHMDATIDPGLSQLQNLMESQDSVK